MIIVTFCAHIASFSLVSLPPLQLRNKFFKDHCSGCFHVEAPKGQCPVNHKGEFLFVQRRGKGEGLIMPQSFDFSPVVSNLEAGI